MNHRQTFLQCDGCRVKIDRDTDEDFYLDAEGQAFCAKCRAAWETEGRALAAEYQAERLERETPVLCKRCGEGFTIETIEQAGPCGDLVCPMQGYVA